ncbi:COG2426 family protein [Halalkalibacter urbisdiaboli]|uniref:COG2426 family protein n=1 Tax=Halalkalibacter urbisdiaboli TaxID=1960589 RepID=UPI001FD8F622|nr:small multi-drug export protein [Halalkalibacter urbisdiaboli]
MKETIQQFVLDHFGFLPQEALVMFISALPILELRAGIPIAAALGLTATEAFLYGIIGNILPIIPILLLFRPVSKWMLRFSLYKRFYDWLYNRTMKKSNNVEKFGAIGLILFTAVPLPTTGAWSASLAAILFFIPFRSAFIAISTGVVVAGVGVTLFVYSIF